MPAEAVIGYVLADKALQGLRVKLRTWRFRRYRGHFQFIAAEACETRAKGAFNPLPCPRRSKLEGSLYWAEERELRHVASALSQSRPLKGVRAILAGR